MTLSDTNLMNNVSSHWDKEASNASWSNADARMTRSGTTTTYEWMFELDELLSNGKSVGFDFLIVDKDKDDADDQQSLYMWGPSTGKSQSPTRIGDALFIKPGKETGTLKGKVAWQEGVETDNNFKRVRITDSTNPAFWLHTNVSESGEFEVDLPTGEYKVSSAYQMLGNPWSELYIPDRSTYVTAQVEANTVNTAKILLTPRVSEPDLISDSGILLSAEKIDQKKLERDIKAYMDYFNVPGASVALVKGSELAYHNVFGVKNNYTQEPVTESTLFEGASITKAVFAFAVNRLAERGEIDLDKPLYEYLPFEAIAHDERYKKITGRHALSHQTGFPNWAWQNEDNKLDIKFYPGIKYGYSGEGFEYLGRVVSHITGKTLEEVIHDEVQIPFNYETNLYFSDVPEVKENVSHGHYASYAAPIGTPNGIGVAHSMQTEAKSFSKFMIGLLKEKGLSEQGYFNMLEPQIEVPSDPEEGDESWPERYGLGFHMTKTPIGLGYGHGGNNGDFTCYFYVYPEHDIGFAIFTNSDSGTAFHKKMHEYLVLGKTPLN
jgi:CubicO group peptidase (beta-lactamase class C family)